MIRTTLRVRPTRIARDLLTRKRFVVERRFPGGRGIVLGKAETRQRTFKLALQAAQPQSSPTAAAGSPYVQGAPPNDGGYARWKRYGDEDIIVY